MNTSRLEVDVIDNSEKSRYEGRLGSHVVGYILYDAQPGSIRLVHTEVDPTHEGRGVGSTLAAAALEDIRRRGLSVVPICPFVRAYIEGHPEYGDLVARR